MLAEVLRSLGRKPVTTRYPLVKLEMPAHFRGKLKFDASKCIGCKMCMRDCPSGAITITKVGEKQFEAEIDLSRCIYCAQCVDSCPKGALETTPEFELAGFDRSKMKVVFRAAPGQAIPQKADVTAEKPQSEPDKKA
jgi:formate hydrogenlyase subunit 6/NADH:ubiquinone oxidoreductase subunit I